jgi:hypothetical protein
LPGAPARTSLLKDPPLPILYVNWFFWSQEWKLIDDLEKKKFSGTKQI